MKRWVILLILLSFTLSCGTNQSVSNSQNTTKIEATSTPTATPVASLTPKSEKKGHTHEHKAPRGGTLVVFGNEFAHLELVLDAAAGKITVYVLDGEAEKSIQIAQEEIEIEIEKPKKFSLKLLAVENALTGEKKGATSEFTVQSDELKGLKEFEAIVKSIKVKGREFTAEKFNFPKGNEH